MQNAGGAGLSQRQSDMVKSQQIYTADKRVRFSAIGFRAVVGGGGGGLGEGEGGHISIDLVGWHLSSCLQTGGGGLFATRHLSLQTGPPTVKRLFSQETAMAHYYEAICCVKTNRNYLHTAVMTSSSYIFWMNRPHLS